MGSTGNSTGPHLHFEVRKDAYDKYSAIDPSTLIKGSEATKVKDEIAVAVANKEAAKAEEAEEDKVVLLANHDTNREVQNRSNAPTVKPPKMVPSALGIGGSTTSYETEDVAVAESYETELPQLNRVRAATITARKAVSEPAEVEAAVLQQKRAQLSQEVANNRSSEQLDAIGQVLVEQLMSQKRMEEALGEIAKNTKSTSDGVHAGNRVVKDVPAQAEIAKVNAPVATGSDLSKLFNKGSKGKVKYPLSMGRA